MATDPHDDARGPQVLDLVQSGGSAQCGSCAPPRGPMSPRT